MTNGVSESNNGSKKGDTTNGRWLWNSSGKEVMVEKWSDLRVVQGIE